MEQPVTPRRPALLPAEEWAALLKRRLDDLTRLVSDWVWEIDRAHRLIYVSDRVLEVLGFHPHELVGRRFSDLGTFASNRNRSLRSGWKSPFRDLIFETKDCNGRARSFLVSGLPVFDRETGAFEGARGTAEDITERKRMEGELLRHQKMESLGGLAGGMAHNFNNLLLPILGLSKKTLETLPARSEERENMEMVVRACERARDLVDQILVFGRRTEIKRDDIDIHPIVQESTTLARAMLPRSVSLTETLDPTTGVVFADAAQIGAVIMNLISNAVDALDGGKGEVSVSLSRVDVDQDIDGVPAEARTGPNARIRVGDNGKGMDEETRKRIFDPFFTTKDVDKGMGLGLSSAYGTVTSHDGVIVFSSQPDAGTTMDVYLPLVDRSVERHGDREGN
ncbi:MAG: ATP-binding protein [Rhodospirillales bacterium]|jgi:PAS domain S-box-containing protein|nr:ATP-binding protein [Rhodospirillales bacterium]